MSTIKKFTKLYLSLIVLGLVVYAIQRITLSPVLQDISVFCMLGYTGFVCMESLDYVKDKIKGVKVSD